MMKTPCKTNFQFPHVVISLMNILSRQRVFRLQKTLDAMLDIRGAIALSRQYRTNKLKLASLADAKEEFSVMRAYSNGILLGLILPVFGVIFTVGTPSHNTLAKNYFRIRISGKLWGRASSGSYHFVSHRLYLLGIKCILTHSSVRLYREDECQ